MVVGFGVVGLAIGVLAGSAGVRPAPPPVSIQPSLSSPEGALVPVHVSGSVVSPGVVWIPEGSLVSDAIAAAGGALPEANLDQTNLAGTVFEGEQINVASDFADPGPDGSAGGGGLIDINHANATELQTLPGVGPVLASNIVAHRDNVGRFESIEDLLDVPGIGETRLASIRDLIRPP